MIDFHATPLVWPAGGNPHSFYILFLWEVTSGAWCYAQSWTYAPVPSLHLNVGSFTHVPGSVSVSCKQSKDKVNRPQVCRLTCRKLNGSPCVLHVSVNEFPLLPSNKNTGLVGSPEVSLGSWAGHCLPWAALARDYHGEPSAGPHGRLKSERPWRPNSREADSEEEAYFHSPGWKPAFGHWLVHLLICTEKIQSRFF